MVTPIQATMKSTTVAMHYSPYSPLKWGHPSIQDSLVAPVPRMHSEGSSDCSWPGGLNIYIYIFFNLSKYSLLEVHYNAERLLFKFNRFQYTLAAAAFIHTTLQLHVHYYTTI